MRRRWWKIDLQLSLENYSFESSDETAKYRKKTVEENARKSCYVAILYLLIGIYRVYVARIGHEFH